MTEALNELSAARSERVKKYRAEVRETFSRMTIAALHFQDQHISRNDCVDRQEIDRALRERGIHA